MAGKDIKPRTETGLTRREALKKAVETVGGAVASSALDTSILGGLADLVIGEEELVIGSLNLRPYIDRLIELEEENMEIHTNPYYSAVLYRDLGDQYDAREETDDWEVHNNDLANVYIDLVDELDEKISEQQLVDKIASDIHQSFYTKGVMARGLDTTIEKRPSPFLEELYEEEILPGDPRYILEEIDVPLNEEEFNHVINTEMRNVIGNAILDYKQGESNIPVKELPSQKKKLLKKSKNERLIDSAADLARRLSAPPTGTVPKGRQVKPPVQEPKPTQPKIPALEQPTEQGKGLSNLARMLPAVGRRLPFIAPAATLLRSKPAGVDADIVPPDPLGTGRVYRNYHDYNPRNI
jgi:hypothetical protein